MIKFTDDSWPVEGSFAACITTDENIYMGQISYEDDLICFTFFVNEKETDVSTEVSNIKEWMQLSELGKYYNF